MDGGLRGLVPIQLGDGIGFNDREGLNSMEGDLVRLL
jgi:hypothetical protein